MLKRLECLFTGHDYKVIPELNVPKHENLAADPFMHYHCQCSHCGCKRQFHSCYLFERTYWRAKDVVRINGRMYFYNAEETYEQNT